MALDWGDRRVGVALSDPLGRVAIPRCVLDTAQVRRRASAFTDLVEETSPKLLLVGLPLTLAGKMGPQARKVRSEAGQLAHDLGIPLEFWDERLSSEEAERIVREQGRTTRDARGSLDMIAASLFLQSYLDAHQADPEGEPDDE